MAVEKKNIIKKYVILFVSLFLVFLLLFLSVVVLRYSGLVRFYEPITINIQTTDTANLSEISAYGNTPFGRQIALSKNGNQFSSGNGFLKELVIFCPTKSYYDTCIITIIAGKQIFSGTLSQLKNNWQNTANNTSVAQYSSSSSLQSQGSIIFFFFSVFKWTPGKYLLIAVIAIFLLLLTVFVFLDFRTKHFSRKLLFRTIIVTIFVAFSGLLFYQLTYANGIHTISGLIAVIWSYILLTGIISIFVRKNKKIHLNLLLTVTVFFILIFITESVLRFSILRTYSEKNESLYKSPYSSENKGWYKVRMSNSSFVLSTSEYSFSRKTNSLGLSDIEPPVEKDTNEFLIIGLGDSFTEGDGTDSDSTWLKFLERSLNNDTAKKTRFINAGICGSDPFYEFVLLRDKLLQYHPDLVIAALGYEIDDIICRGGMERFQKNGSVKYKNPPWWENIFALSYLFRLGAHAFFDINYLLLPPEKHKAACEVAISQLKESIDLFNVLSKNNDFNLLFVFYPMKDEVINKNFIYWNEIISHAKSKGSETVNLLDYYVKEVGITNKNIEKYYWTKDGHHKAAGYQAFAQGIEAKMGIIKKALVTICVKPEQP